MDGKSMAFLQKQAGQAVTDCFASGRALDNLLHCATVQIQFYDAMQRSLLDAVPATEPFSCAAGCAACCHRQIVCTIPEAIGIAAWLGDGEKTRVQAAARQLHDETARMDESQRIRTGLPCPLLVDGQCSVYETRPLACRALYSFDRQACDRLYRDFAFETKVPRYDLMIEAHGQMLLGYGRALDRLGLDGSLVELSQALRIILDAPDAITRYLAGEKPFEAAKLGREALTPL
jgi:Fe-S-cluster containining protein